jgi:hypothetical protein
MTAEEYSFRHLLPGFIIPPGTQVVLKVDKTRADGLDLDWPFHDNQLKDLECQLDGAFRDSTLPEDRDRLAIDRFLVERRLASAATT